MPTFAHDFLDVIERELEEERERLARLVDRVEALAELQTYAYDLATQLKKPLSIEDVLGSGKTEHQRAKLRSLADRITATEPGGHPAHRDGHDGGTLLETGAGF
jgi:hypothetical protein